MSLWQELLFSSHQCISGTSHGMLVDEEVQGIENKLSQGNVWMYELDWS